MPAKMNTSQIQKAFKIMCKLIYCSNQGPTDALTYRTAMSGMVEQMATGSGVDANAIVSVGSPAAAVLNTVNSTLTTLTSTFKQQVQNYLTQVMAVDQGGIAGTAASTVGTQLVSDMNDASNLQTVAPSGGIYLYFANNFSINLPQAVSSGASTIRESWVTPVAQ